MKSFKFNCGLDERKANGGITEGNHDHEYFAETQYTFIIAGVLKEASPNSRKYPKEGSGLVIAFFFQKAYNQR